MDEGAHPYASSRLLCRARLSPEPKASGGAASLFLRAGSEKDPQGVTGGTLARLGSEESRLHTASRRPCGRSVRQLLRYDIPFAPTRIK